MNNKCQLSNLITIKDKKKQESINNDKQCWTRTSAQVCTSVYPLIMRHLSLRQNWRTDKYNNKQM